MEDEIKEIEQTVFGFRIVNTEVLRCLKLCIEAETNKKIRADKGLKIGLVLSQMKYWYDIKCKENKHKHYFYKSANELNYELPIIDEENIRCHLKLLTDLGILLREQGLYKGNFKTYSYELNLAHPINILSYLAESANKITNEKTYDHKGEKIFNQHQFLSELTIEEILDGIKNKTARDSIPKILANASLEPEKIVPPKQGDENDTNESVPPKHRNRPSETQEPSPLNTGTVPPKHRNPTKITLRPSKNFSETNERLYVARSPHFLFFFSLLLKRTFFYFFPKCGSENRAYISSLGFDTSKLLDCDIGKSVICKLQDLPLEKIYELKYLKIGGWRKNSRNGYYKDFKKCDDAKKWFDNLAGKDKELVQAFQEDQFNCSAKISKEWSYDCSLIDAKEGAENFLQFVLRKIGTTPLNINEDYYHKQEIVA